MPPTPKMTIIVQIISKAFYGSRLWEALGNVYTKRIQKMKDDGLTLCPPADELQMAAAEAACGKR